MTVYLCDDTPDGFYSAVFRAYGDKNTDADVSTLAAYQGTLDTVFVRVQTDAAHALRVKNAVCRCGGYKACKDVESALRSDCPEKAGIAFRYVKRLLKEKRDISRCYSFDEVMPFGTLVDKVWTERHRFTGFLRFEETAGGILYAAYTPDNDITDILAPHFVRRLNMPFVIHDKRRGRFAVWNGKELADFYTDAAPDIKLSDAEKQIESLWKGYFKAVDLKERPHKKQQDGYLPRRYRKNMCEFGED